MPAHSAILLFFVECMMVGDGAAAVIDKIEAVPETRLFERGKDNEEEFNGGSNPGNGLNENG